MWVRGSFERASSSDLNLWSVRGHFGLILLILADTDSIFCRFPPDPTIPPSDRTAKVAHAMKQAHAASEEFKRIVLHDKKPHDLEYDKTFFPFILLSKKRFVAFKINRHPHPHPFNTLILNTNKYNQYTINRIRVGGPGVEDPPVGV